MQNSFYFTINLILFVYACYSWYWQAKLKIKGKFRLSILIWTLLVIWLAFTWNYIVKSDPGIDLFLALILLVSIIDGSTGFAEKRMVVSGYFKRTVKYQDLENVLLIALPLQKTPSTICILGTSTGRQYSLQLKADPQEIVNFLRKVVDHHLKIEIRNTLG